MSGEYIHPGELGTLPPIVLVTVTQGYRLMDSPVHHTLPFGRKYEHINIYTCE